MIGEAAELTEEDSIMTRLLSSQECSQLNDQEECSHITAESQQTMNLLQVTTRLFLDAQRKTQEIESSLEEVLDYLVGETKFCHKNILRMKIIYFHLFHNAMKTTFEQDAKQSVEVPVLFHLEGHPIRLSTTTDETANKFIIETEEPIDIPPFGSKCVQINFNLLFNNFKAYISNPGILKGGICTLQNIVEKPYLLSVEQVRFDNLSSSDLIVPVKFPILSYTSVGKEKFHLMEMHKNWFPDTKNFILYKKFSTLEYLSNILKNQYVDMSKYKHEIEKLPDITGEALEWEETQKIINNYKKTSDVGQNMSRLIQTLHTCRKDFDPQAISHLQQYEYPQPKKAKIG